MASFEVEGKLIKKYDTEQKTASFQSREFVIEVPDGSYPQFVKFQLVQDRCALLDSFQENEMMKVSFDLRGREWQGKYFTNLNAWRLEKAAENASPPAMGASTSASAGFPTAGTSPSTPPPAPMDDLPF
ncbi:MAG: hypothetical protein RLY31_1193 [Bacteroidota bacterium]|jgi:hypothetical protein